MFCFVFWQKNKQNETKEKSFDKNDWNEVEGEKTKLTWRDGRLKRLERARERENTLWMLKQCDSPPSVHVVLCYHESDRKIEMSNQEWNIKIGNIIVLSSGKYPKTNNQNTNNICNKMKMKPEIQKWEVGDGGNRRRWRWWWWWGGGGEGRNINKFHNSCDEIYFITVFGFKKGFYIKNCRGGKPFRRREFIL